MQLLNARVINLDKIEFLGNRGVSQDAPLFFRTSFPRRNIGIFEQYLIIFLPQKVIGERLLIVDNWLIIVFDQKLRRRRGSRR